MASTSTDEYDFVVVGGGTAGCLLANRLSHAASRPSVLVVEAGTKPEGEFLRAPFHRFAPCFARPDLDHGHVSIPQKNLDGRTITYTRGKGLGGSSILNFAVYLYGSGEDYNRWADMVGDDAWRWENTQKSFKEIETFDTSGAKQYSHLASPCPEDHGSEGFVKVCLPDVLEEGIKPCMEALAAHGETINLDANSGNPIGISVFPSSYSKDGRTTSATAHLMDAPDNLKIWTNAAVHKLVFEGHKVVGIETADGRKASSNKEVILCSGSIDTPRLLLLNGIGPATELEALGIEVVSDLPGVGKQLHDHNMVFLAVEVDSSHNNKYAFEKNNNLMLEADRLWKKDRTGDFSLHNSGLWGGFLKAEGLEEWPEYKALDPSWQEFLSREAVPTYEFISNCILFVPDTVLADGSSYIGSVAVLMNAQSEGSVTLASADPAAKPVIDMGFLEHAYDRRAMREAIRQTWTKLFENPAVKKVIKKPICGPKSLSDEDIDAFVNMAVTTVWHANGTAMMGRKENALACVDSNFKVYGVDGLRVADMSVCPLTPSNHAQSTAYLVGHKAADKLGAEYKL